jgi:hypothetical protein
VIVSADRTIVVAEIANFTKNALDCSGFWSEMKGRKKVFPLEA